MFFRLWPLVLALAAPLPALGDAAAVRAAADALFPQMPELQERTPEDRCGWAPDMPSPMAYCTSDNTIYWVPGALEADDATYRTAHLLGHAIQVRHGIADIALRTIRARPSEEAALRGMVTRQVECLAGVLYAEAGLPFTRLDALYDAEPFTGSHWGRNPLRIGPKVSIGLEARARWFDRGQMAGDIAACAVGEIPTAPLEDALRSAPG
ncbi:hypothetical protein [Pseudaestuariivita sp.]|uniref:hypothetical protein n=1 Tax=Pseudaestuariivita sp. TaxID=2211669 RepID=UPI004059BF89